MDATAPREPWQLAGRSVNSRLFVPTSFEPFKQAVRSLRLAIAIQAIIASGTQFLIMGTSSSCSMGSERERQGSIPLGEVLVETQKALAARGEQRTFYFLINTSRSTTADEAVERALRGHAWLRETPLKTDLIKLEVYNPATHAPVDGHVLRSVEQLRRANPNLAILPFITKDRDLAVELAKTHGCPALRIFGSTIGSNGGLGDERELERIVDAVYPTPVIAEGGIATPEHIQRGLDMGVTAFLVNGAFQSHPNPVQLATELRMATEVPAFRYALAA